MWMYIRNLFAKKNIYPVGRWCNTQIAGCTEKNIERKNMLANIDNCYTNETLAILCETKTKDINTNLHNELYSIYIKPKY